LGVVVSAILGLMAVTTYLIQVYPESKEALLKVYDIAWSGVATIPVYLAFRKINPFKKGGERDD